MIDNRNPDYAETLSHVDNLRSVIKHLEINLSAQIPQGQFGEFSITKNNFLTLIDEIEFTLSEYTQ